MSHTINDKQQQVGNSLSSAAHTTQLKTAGNNGVQYTDNRPGTVAQRQVNAALGSEGVIQRYTYGKGATRNVTVTGANGTRKFEECYYNFVEYKKGEKKQHGSGTKAPASWAGWVKNQGNGNNASQLHVVNARWGGLGGQNDGNIIPGSPAENSHHLHQGEKKFDDCFDGGNAAIDDCKYECLATPAYGTAVDVSKGAINVNDPTLSVYITDKSGTKNYPIGGGDGLRFVDGS